MLAVRVIRPSAHAGVLRSPIYIGRVACLIPCIVRVKSSGRMIKENFFICPNYLA